MAKSKTSDHSSIRAKVFASQEEILHAIAKLQGRISQVEELGKEGLPYRDALRVTAEVQIKETIRETFGEHSPEFRIHQHHRIKSHDEEDLAETCSMLEGLIENLEEKRRSLLGGGAPAARPSPSKERTEPLPSKPLPPAKPASTTNVPPQRPLPAQSSRPSKPVTDTPLDLVAARAAEPRAMPTRSVPAADPLGRIRTICLRFHAVARQIRQRHEGRPTLDVEDRHDVSDLLHALLRLDFEDVKAEPWTPASSGGQERTDFLIEHERIVITVKKTRHGFGAKEIAEQVSLDFQQYAAHPHYTTVFCFIYDPEGRIGNPRQVEAELKLQREGRTLEALIAPK